MWKNQLILKRVNWASSGILLSKSQNSRSSLDKDRILIKSFIEEIDKIDLEIKKYK